MFSASLVLDCIKKDGDSICSAHGLTALSRVFIILSSGPSPPLFGQGTGVTATDRVWWLIMWTPKGRWWFCFTVQRFLECPDSSHGQERSTDSMRVCYNGSWFDFCAVLSCPVWWWAWSSASIPNEPLGHDLFVVICRHVDVVLKG